MPEQINRIKELREEKSMTQLRLSVELGVSQETISAYEIGKHYPSVTSLTHMSELFDASMDYIMGLSPVRRIITEKALPDDEARLLHHYRKLDAIRKEKAHSYLQGMSHDI